MGSAYTVFEVECGTIEAEAWSAQGRHAEAEAALRRVKDEADRFEARPTRWRAGLALSAALHAQGRAAEARAEAADVLTLLDRFAAEVVPEPLVASFRDSDVMRQARTLSTGTR